MEEKQQVKELAKLKLIGRPVVAGSTSWFAIRPLPRLVHIYYDFKLLVMLQFPEDPRFLLFVPLHEDTPGATEVKGTVGDPDFAALVVITSDGNLWWISRIDNCSQLERVSKRLKKDGPRRIKANTKKVLEHERHIFEDRDICKDTELYSPDDVYAEFDAEWHSSRKMRPSCKVLESRGSRSPSLKVQLQCVQPEASIGKLPGASIVAVGPDGLIALVSSSRSLPILLDGTNLSPANVPSLERLFSSDDHVPIVKAKATCLLFATMKRSKQSHSWGGVCLSPRLFNAFGQSFVGAKPKHLLLQGDVAGLVHIFPINYPSQISGSTILCDLQEPISNLIAVPLEKDDNALLVVGSHGRLIAISTSRSESDSTPLSSISKLSCMKLFHIELTAGFDVYDWRIGAPLVSPILFGSQYLCFGAALNLCIVNVLDIASDAKGHHLPNQSALTRTEKTDMKKSFIWKTLPLGDVIIALVGHGPSAHAMTSRSLVALTSRGRLIALDVPLHNMKASYSGCYSVQDASKSWEFRGKKMTEDNVMVLLDKISAVESCMEDIQSLIKSMDCVLSELAFALRLTYDVLSCRKRHIIWASNQSFAGSLIKGFHCHLQVNPVVHMVPASRLCFSLSPSQLPVNSYHTENFSSAILNLKLTLHNYTPYPLSSYWALCLEVWNLEETANKRKLFYSSIINDGYGLAVGASSTVVFQVPCAGRILTPLTVSVFMCHINENHVAMMQAKLPSNVKGFIDNKQKSCQNHDVPQVACLLLARYRLDILSLLRQSQRLQHSLDLCPSFDARNLHGEAAKATDKASTRLRPFHGKFKLRCLRKSDDTSWTSLSAVEKWKDFHMEEIAGRCALSRNGEELTGTDLHGNSLLLILDNKLHGREGEVSCKQIQISSPSSLTGFLAREAVLWRVKRSLRDQGIIESHRRDTQENVEGDRVFLAEIEEKLRSIADDARNIDGLWLARSYEFVDAEFIDDRVGQAYNLYKLLMETFRVYRENDVSNPFSSAVTT